MSHVCSRLWKSEKYSKNFVLLDGDFALPSPDPPNLYNRECLVLPPPSRVLIVDDHEATRRGVRSIFADRTWEVCGEAENGRDAVEKVRELKPDLVILDISMPVMNGLQATREIRALALSTKILIFSMHESAYLEEVLRAAGAHAFVSKTASMGRLIETAETLLRPKLQHQ